MRRRSTFIPHPDVDFDPEKVQVNSERLSLQGLRASREEKFSFGVQALPTEIAQLFRNLYELHVRWVDEAVYVSTLPYSSSLNPGLHVHTTPQSDGQLHQICPLLKAYFSTNIKCESLAASFSQPDILSTRFSSSASTQFYTILPSLHQLVAKLQATVCRPSDTICTHSIALLNLANYLDIDFDSISQTVTLSPYWSKPPETLLNPVEDSVTYNEWALQIDSSPNDKIEVGVLKSSETPTEKPQIHMEGYIAAVGDDEKLKPTMFFAPSRHHRSLFSQKTAQKYSVTFDHPTGLHPTMRIRFPSASHVQQPEDRPQDSVCGLHTYATLPSVIFADEYAFPTTDVDPLFTAAHNIQTLRSFSGERDLEVPDYVVKQWGSALLIELATPNKTQASQEGSWDITIPLHLRYLDPTEHGQQSVDIPWPIVFWACTADDGTKFNVNPFDRINLGYDGLFGPRTMFYHLQPIPTNGTRLIERIEVPVLDTSVLSHNLAETLTTLLVLGGFAWVAFKVVREILASLGTSKMEDAVKQQKKE